MLSRLVIAAAITTVAAQVDQTLISELITASSQVARIADLPVRFLFRSQAELCLTRML